MQIVDTHAHLDMPQFAQDLAAVLDRALAAGVGVIICVGTDLASSVRCVELARAHPDRIRAGVGVHPTHTARDWRDGLRRLEELAALPEVVAVGETGLDCHHDAASLAEQIEAFRDHVRLARALDKPLVVHARKADEHVLRVLDEDGEGVRGVRHCFDAALPVAERYVELGLHLGVAAHITRPGFKKLRHALAAAPADRLILETDCPYQPPASQAGRRNEPAFIVETVEALAALRGTSPEDVAAVTAATAGALFGLDG